MAARSSSESGRYLRGRKLGEGAYGTVYEATDQLRNRQVALKTLRHFDSDIVLRFKHEFRALADIRHRNLVRLEHLMAEGEEWLGLWVPWLEACAGGGESLREKCTGVS